MKRYTVLAILLFLNFPSLAQEKPDLHRITIEIDDETKQITNGAFNLKSGDYYQIKLEGINTYLYKISIGDTDIVIPAQKLPVNPISLFQFEGVTDLVKNIISQSLAITPSKNNLIDLKLVDSLNIEKGIDFKLIREDFTVDDQEFVNF